MASGAAATLYVAYYDPVANDLKFDTRSASGTWASPQTIDSTLDAGQYVSLALDASGLPAVAYYDANAARLKYAHYNGSTWSIQTVDNTRRTGSYPSLAFSNGVPSIT